MNNNKPPKKPLSKELHYGLYSTALIILVVALVVIFISVLDALPTRYTQFDISESGLFSLSEETEDTVAQLNEDVSLYWITSQKNEDTAIGTLLERYDELSDHLTVATVDPYLNPNFAEQYTDELENENSIIAVSNSRSYLVDFYDFYIAEYDADGNYSEKFAGESALTAAITYVTSNSFPKIYVLTGHGEVGLTEAYASAITAEGFEVRELSLLSKTEMPNDCACLIIPCPQYDINETELAMIRAYLKEGGDMLLFTHFNEGGYPNIEALMDEYGVSLNDGIVAETDQSRMLWGYSSYLLPVQIGHKITDPIIEAGFTTIIPLAQGISVKDKLPEGISVYEFLRSSDTSFSKTDTANIDDGTLSFDPSKDIPGPFSLGVAITEADSKIVWYTSYYLLEDAVNTATSNTNCDLIVNSIDFLADREESISIRAKELGSAKLVISAGTAKQLSIIVVVLVPLAVIIPGVVIVVRRRRH